MPSSQRSHKKGSIIWNLNILAERQHGSEFEIYSILSSLKILEKFVAGDCPGRTPDNSLKYSICTPLTGRCILSSDQHGEQCNL